MHTETVVKHISAMIAELQQKGRDGVPGAGFPTAQQSLIGQVAEWVETNMPVVSVRAAR